MATVLVCDRRGAPGCRDTAQPFVPEAAAKLLDLLALPAADRHLAAIGAAHRLVPGTALPQPQPIFPRSPKPEAA